jgi:tetratricopeptide (TPR) repeat protein
LLDHVSSTDPPTEYFILRGRLETQLHRYNRAESDFQAGLKRNPNQPNVLYALGLVRLQLGKYTGARDALRQSIQLVSTNPQSWLALAEAYAGLNEKAQVNKSLQRAMELGGNSAAISFGVGTVYQKVGELADAAHSFRRAADLDPANKTASARCVRALIDGGNLDEARATAQEWRTAHSASIAQNVEIGTVFGEAQLYPEAIVQFRAVLDATPSLIAVKYNLALAYLFNGDLALSSNLAQELATSDPQGDSQNLLGLIKEEQGDFAGARAAFDASLQIHSDSAGTYFDLGRVDLELSHFDDAMRDFAATARLCSRCTEALIGTANVYKLEGKFDEAIATINDVIRRHPDDEIGYLYLGDILIRARKYHEASQALKKAVAVNASSSLAHYMYAYSLLKENPDAAPPEAVSSLQAAIRLGPKSGLAYLRLGTIYLKRGDYAQARTLLKTAVTLEPNIKDAHFQLATALKKSGEPELAQKEFDRFRALADQQIQEDTRMTTELRHISPR